MAELNQNYRCKVCGGDLGWDPTAQKWKCKYCDTEFDLKDMEEEGKTELHEETYEKGKAAAEFGHTQATDDTGVDPQDLRMYKCRYCGAEVITDKNTAATFCVYCNNPIVLEEQLVNGFEPEYVIPFKNTKKQVMEKYLAFIKKPFTPNSFMSEEHVEKIKGVYIPFWLYDARVSGEVQAECENIRRTRSGNIETTHHKVYEVKRGGKLEFDHIPVDASSKTDNHMMDSIEPYLFKEIQKFEMPYLAGFMAERYDEDDKTCYPRAKDRAIHTMRTKLTNSIKGYDRTKVKADNLHLEDCQGHYALLPVWLLYSQYQGKNYTFAMNGQTGKMVGDIPIDNAKRLRYFFKWTGIVWAGASAISTIAVFVSMLS